MYSVISIDQWIEWVHIFWRHVHVTPGMLASDATSGLDQYNIDMQDSSTPGADAGHVGDSDGHHQYYQAVWVPYVVLDYIRVCSKGIKWLSTIFRSLNNCLAGSAIPLPPCGISIYVLADEVGNQREPAGLNCHHAYCYLPEITSQEFPCHTHYQSRFMGHPWLTPKLPAIVFHCMLKNIEYFPALLN